MYFLPFSCRFYHTVDQLCLFGHDWLYQNRRKNSRQWGYLIFNVTLVDTFFLLWSTRSVFCRMTVGLLSAKRPLTAFVCWHFSPAITPKLLIVERKARLDSKEEIKRSQCTKFKMCQLFLALLKALFVCVCVASALRGLHQLQWIYKRFSFSSGKCLHMLWFPCLPRIVQSQSDERWPRSYWSRTHPQQLQNKGNIFPSPPRLNPSRTMFLFPFWVYENWTCCFFSSHPPLIFSSILLFRSLLLTNKLKQHAFVHFHRKTSCSGLLRVGLSISTIISKLFKHPWQLPPLLTPWRRFDTHRFEPTAFFFFLHIFTEGLTSRLSDYFLPVPTYYPLLAPILSWQIC